ncbi:YihY/virulence factor BrkB family protein [Lysinimonas soli]|uniref:YihY/virulence factor BrkB family protein n=1 Tax=Lysinimonas soli TaxID=1074233 RepID=A0ABW0NVX8_9MICO
MAAPQKSAGRPFGPLVARVSAVVARVQKLKPVRVFIHYGQQRGPILASGLAFQGLFAVFAALWVGFSIAGLVISGDTAVQHALLTALDSAIPGLIDTGDGGAIKAKVLLSAGVFGWTGAIALVGLVITATGWLSSARDAVRSMFELPSPFTNFALLKLRDIALGIGLCVVVIASAALSVASTSATSFLLGLLGIESTTVVATIAIRIVTLGVMFLLDAFVLAALYRVLAAVRIPRHRAWAGARLAALGIGVLKLLGSALLGGASSNPLIASFAVIAGLLIFFNLACQVVLLGAAWIEIGLEDAGIEIDPRVAAIRLENARRLVAAHTEPQPEAGGLGELFTDPPETEQVTGRG